MNSFKKIILSSVLIGSAGSIQAFTWQDTKNFCNSLYGPCAQAIQNAPDTLSTRAYDLGNLCQRCIDFVCKNATEVKNFAVSNKDSALIKVGNLRDATVKVAAPVVAPVAHTAKAGAHGLVSVAQFSYENPKLVTVAGFATMAAYLAHCRNATLHWLADLKDVQATITAINPNNNFKDWHLKPQVGKPAWTIADLMKNKRITYAALKRERGNVGESDNAFINRMLGKDLHEGELQKEQTILNAEAEKIKSHCLANAHLVPSFSSHEYKKEHNFVTELIQDRINAMEDSERYIDLSPEQMAYIDKQISGKVARSYINPFKIARRWALPYEADAIKKYWEIFQAIQRIEALKACVQNEREELNRANDPRSVEQLRAPQLPVVSVMDNLQ